MKALKPQRKYLKKMNKKVHRIPYLGYHTRAYVLGDLNKGVPLIILHGGPGGCVERYEPLEKLADFGVPLIFYDQLGCGYSRVPKNHKISWNFRIFLDELFNLINYFGLTKYNILGHSWGGMLALEYVCNFPHDGLEKLILFSTLPSTKIWNDEHTKMLEEFSEKEKETLLAERDGKEFDKKIYKIAIKKFYKNHVGKRSKDLYPFNTKRFPKTNKEIYEKMWGKSELFGTGTLKDWNVENKLHNIKVPTLILSGALDESSPAMNELMNKEIKNSKWVLLKKSHHIGYVEETDLVIDSIKSFIL